MFEVPRFDLLWIGNHCNSSSYKCEDLEDSSLKRSYQLQGGTVEASHIN
jgi:hypothetical protein